MTLPPSFRSALPPGGEHYTHQMVSQMSNSPLPPPLLAVSSWLHPCWFMTNQPRSSWKSLCAAGFRHCLLCAEWPSRQTTTHELKSFPAAPNTREPRRGSSGFPSKALGPPSIDHVCIGCCQPNLPWDEEGVACDPLELGSPWGLGL